MPDINNMLIEQIVGIRESIEDIQREEKPRVNALRYRKATAQAIVSTAWVRLNYEAKDYDTLDQVVTGAGWVFTAKQAGYYRIKASLLMEPTTAWNLTEAGHLAICNDAGTLLEILTRQDNYPTGASLYMWYMGYTERYVAKGEKLAIYTYQGSGVTLNTYTDSAFNSVTISKI